MKKKINIEVNLTDDNQIESVTCSGDDIPQTIDGKAMLLSLFDKETLETVKIDLWTSDFQLQEMDRFIFQSLRSMADTYFKATKNTQLASEMQSFIQHFGIQTKILIDNSEQ